MSDSPRRFRACLLEKSEIFSQLSTADQRIRTAYAFRFGVPRGRNGDSSPGSDATAFAHFDEPPLGSRCFERFAVRVGEWLTDGVSPVSRKLNSAVLATPPVARSAVF